MNSATSSLRHRCLKFGTRWRSNRAVMLEEWSFESTWKFYRSTSAASRLGHFMGELLVSCNMLNHRQCYMRSSSRWVGNYPWRTACWQSRVLYSVQFTRIKCQIKAKLSDRNGQVRLQALRGRKSCNATGVKDAGRVCSRSSVTAVDEHLMAENFPAPFYRRICFASYFRAEMR